MVPDKSHRPVRPTLAIDVGGGTQDILLWQPDTPIENCVKLVLPSQTVVVANRIRRYTSKGVPIFLTGNLMGAAPVCGPSRNIYKPDTLYTLK